EPLLRQGATGEAVRDLQSRLGAAGHDSSADRQGVYGPATEAAVRSFQERRGLRVDGICGPQTWGSVVEAGYRLGDRLLYHTSPPTTWTARPRPSRPTWWAPTSSSA